MNKESLEPTDVIAVTRMFQMIGGFMRTQAISVAARLGIADLVGEAPKTVDELAVATRTHSVSLRRLLQCLASRGIFTEDPEGRYQNTPMSSTLRSDDPRSVRTIAIMYGAPFFWRPWGEMYEAVVTGQPSFDRVFGASFFDYLSGHSEDASIFDAAMSAGALAGLSVIQAVYDFSRFERIVDVGGGHGALLEGILSANPRLHGVLVDLPAVVAGASALRAGTIGDRCEIVGTDFFVSIPEGGDAYLIKSVLHNWNDDDALRILRNCRRAIRLDGNLILVERVLKPANEPDDARFMDLNMLVTLKGRERTESDFGTLLRRAGFSLTRLIAMPAAWSIVEAVPV
jgi:O-methyltransferase/methyltransferase family protein